MAVEGWFRHERERGAQPGNNVGLETGSMKTVNYSPAGRGQLCCSAATQVIPFSDHM